MKTWKKLTGIFVAGFGVLALLEKNNPGINLEHPPFDDPKDKKEIKAEEAVSYENDEDIYPFEGITPEDMKRMSQRDFEPFDVEEGTLTPEEQLRVNKEEMELTEAMKNSYHNKGPKKEL